MAVWRQDDDDRSRAYAERLGTNEHLNPFLEGLKKGFMMLVLIGKSIGMVIFKPLWMGLKKGTYIIFNSKMNQAESETSSGRNRRRKEKNATYAAGAGGVIPTPNSQKLFGLQPERKEAVAMPSTPLSGFEGEDPFITNRGMTLSIKPRKRRNSPFNLNL